MQPPYGPLFLQKHLSNSWHLANTDRPTSVCHNCGHKELLLLKSLKSIQLFISIGIQNNIQKIYCFERKLNLTSGNVVNNSPLDEYLRLTRFTFYSTKQTISLLFPHPNLGDISCTCSSKNYFLLSLSKKLANEMTSIYIFRVKWILIL